MNSGKNLGKNIAFIYNNETWLGGKKYLENLIRSLNYLKKTNLYILSDQEEVNIKLKNVKIIKSNLVNPKSLIFIIRKKA